jgi:hypothetical protein
MLSPNVSEQIVFVAFVWVALIVFVARLTARSGSGTAGLPLAFLIALSFLHCGFIVYAVPGYSHVRVDENLYLRSYDFTAETVLKGTYASLLGVLGFSIGAMFFGKRVSAAAGGQIAPLAPAQRRRILVLLLGLGAAGFLLTALQVNFPMAQALFQVLRNLAVTAICLGPAMILMYDRRRAWPHWLWAAAAIPTTYIVVWGFTSYGFIVFSIFISFWLCVLASRRIGALTIGAASGVVFVGLLSAFVAWMSARDRVREVVWTGGGIGERLAVIGEAIRNIEILQPSNFLSLDWLNIRLNHNIFVGKVLEWHERFPDLKMQGEQLVLIPFALVPRQLWPGKPEMGGSDLLATHSGMRFSESATFGAGPIVEFYVNFGMIGIFFGMLLLGLVVRWIDVKAISSLKRSEMIDFAKWFTVGIAFVAPLTELFFMVNTAMMAFIVLTVIRWATQRQQRGGRARLAAGSLAPSRAAKTRL